MFRPRKISNETLHTVTNRVTVCVTICVASCFVSVSDGALLKSVVCQIDMIHSFITLKLNPFCESQRRRWRSVRRSRNTTIHPIRHYVTWRQTGCTRAATLSCVAVYWSDSMWGLDPVSCTVCPYKCNLTVSALYTVMTQRVELNSLTLISRV